MTIVALSLSLLLTELTADMTTATKIIQSSFESKEGIPVINESGAQRTKDIPEGLDLNHPQNIAKVALMPNDTHYMLIAATADAMREAGIPEERVQIFLRSPLVQPAIGTSLLGQRGAVTAFWNHQFLPLREEGYAARQALGVIGKIFNGSEMTEMFKKYPMDTILKHDLPKG